MMTTVFGRLFALTGALMLAACSGGGEPSRAPAEPTPLLRDGPESWTPPKLVAAPKPKKALGPRINALGVKIIEDSEGLRLEAYRLAGQWLIGYGHAGTAEPGMTITREEARALLIADLKRTEKALKPLLAMPLNENEYSALVALAYNLGVSRFKQTLVYKRLAAGDRAGAADAFLYLDSARIDGEMRELASLKARRKKERALFLTPVQGEPRAYMVEAMN